MDEFQLVPQPLAIPNIKGRPMNANIKPPSLPPPNTVFDEKITNRFIMDLSKAGDTAKYPSMNPNSLVVIKI